MVDFEQGKEFFKESITGKTRLFDRCKNILLKPAQEWMAIKVENPSAERVIFGSLCVLAFLPAIGKMFGRDDFFVALLTAATIYISMVISVIAAAWILTRMARKLESSDDFTVLIQWIVYAWIPMFIGGCFKYIPYLSWVEIAGWIYSLYLLYTGTEVLLKPPETKRFAIVALAVIFWAAFYALASTGVGNILHLFR